MTTKKKNSLVQATISREEIVTKKSPTILPQGFRVGIGDKKLDGVVTLEFYDYSVYNKELTILGSYVLTNNMAKDLADLLLKSSRGK